MLKTLVLAAVVLNAVDGFRFVALKPTHTFRDSTQLKTVSIEADEPKLRLDDNIFVPALPDEKPDDPLQLNRILKAMPAEVFEKSLPKSLSYMAFDYLMWGGLTFGMKKLVQSALWLKLPFIAKAAASLAFWNVAGFFMWAIFVVGHDCGHTTFSKYKWLNDIVGHVTHGSLLVPFYTWQLSHRRHHMYHNHVDKDYSYSWYTEERLQSPSGKVAKFLHDNPLILGIFPFIGWQLYLLGIGDGSHFIPDNSTRLWLDNTPVIERKKCWISAASVMTYLVGFLAMNKFNLANFGFFYFMPHVVFSWWLVCVTYLQHHGPHTVAYSDKAWSYVRAAFETVDRTFGKGIDTLHHHITDGHVIHHIFFTKIPHYHLMKATTALKAYLAENNLSHLYRHEKTHNFPYRLHKDMMTTGFRTTLVSDLPNSPENKEDNQSQIQGMLAP